MGFGKTPCGIYEVVSTDSDHTVKIVGNKQTRSTWWIFDAEYLVLDGYHPADDLADYEWIDGIKGMCADMTCRGMQYAVGGEYDLGEQEVSCAKGFHFCDTWRTSTIAPHMTNPTAAISRCAGWSKKAQLAPYSARGNQNRGGNCGAKRLERKGNLHRNARRFTVGKVYTFTNGRVRDDAGEMRPIRPTTRLYKTLDEWNEVEGNTLVRFIEYQGEANG
jgi:hypothetical protein